MIKKVLAIVGLGLFLSGAANSAQLTVSAAVSLKDAFEEIAQNFETENPEVKIDFNFGASGSLLQQIRHGADVDVFASADLKSMQDAEKYGLVDEGQAINFVQNNLVAIVPADSDLTIKDLNDLTHKAVKQIALGNPDSVPAGRYTKTAFEQAGVTKKIQEKLRYAQNVRQALEYVATHSVDLGFVYETDAMTKKEQTKIVYTQELEEAVIYPIAVIKNTQSPDLAKQWVDFIVSEQAQAILQKFGFSPVKN